MQYFGHYPVRGGAFEDLYMWRKQTPWRRGEGEFGNGYDDGAGCRGSRLFRGVGKTEWYGGWHTDQVYVN
jgi:hypothetical protein